MCFRLHSFQRGKISTAVHHESTARLGFETVSKFPKKLSVIDHHCHHTK